MKQLAGFVSNSSSTAYVIWSEATPPSEVREFLKEEGFIELLEDMRQNYFPQLGGNAFVAISRDFGSSPFCSYAHISKKVKAWILKHIDAAGYDENWRIGLRGEGTNIEELQEILKKYDILNITFIPRKEYTSKVSLRPDRKDEKEYWFR